MVILWAVLALAGPLDELAPLPACTPDTGIQLTLPARVTDVHFDDDGSLWVADWSGLTRRDGRTLEVLERVHPGSPGWAGIADEEGTLYALNALGPSHRIRGDGPLATARGDLAQVFLGLSTFGRPPWSPDVTLPPEPPPGAAVPPTHRQVREVLTGLGAPRTTMRGVFRPTTEDETDPPSPSTHIVTTDRWMRLFGANRELIAERPLTRSTEAAGVVRDRLFTVSGGALRIWSADGEAFWEAPGTWSGAVAVDADLVLADLYGQLWTLKLNRGRLERRACVVGACELPPPPLTAPFHADPDALGALLLGWRDELLDWTTENPPVPLALTLAGDEIVAAQLDPVVWERTGLQRVTALHRVSASGRRVLASTELAEPVLGTVEADGPDTLRVGHQSLLRADLQPVGDAAPSSGPRITVEWPLDHEAARVTVGAMRDGQFLPAQGLPPRLVTALHTQPRGHIVGDRFVLTGGEGADRYPSLPSPTQVGCVPRMDGPPRSVKPGVLAEYDGRGRRSKAPEQRAAAAAGPSYSQLTALSVWFPELRDLSSEGPVLIHPTASSELPPEILALTELGLPLVVNSSAEPPADLPSSIRWVDAPTHLRNPLTVMHRGVQIWSGRLEAFHPEILPRGAAEAAPTDELVARWTSESVRAKELVRDPGTVALLAARDGGDWARVRELLPAAELRLSQEDVARAFQDAPLPEGIRWERPPETDRYLLFENPLQDHQAWRIADELEVPVAVLRTRKLPRPVHPALPYGEWEGDAAWPSGLSTVLVEKGVIRQVLPPRPTLEELQEALGLAP